MAREDLTPQDQAYKYVLDKCKVKWLRATKKYSAFITIFGDHQDYGKTEEIAKHNLAFRLSEFKGIQEFILKQQP